MAESNGLHYLPGDIPIPVDDGAADHLMGLFFPALSFPSTKGGAEDLRQLARDGLVLYVYPRTGKPDEPLPAGWDETPGARGCTVQSLAFRDRSEDLARYGMSVAGLSAQTDDDQAEAARRLDLPFPLLADPDLRLAAALSLPTFDIAGMTLYRRITLVARSGRLTKVFYPVFPPDESAAHVLAWLHQGEEGRRTATSSGDPGESGGPA